MGCSDRDARCERPALTATTADLARLRSSGGDELAGHARAAAVLCRDAGAPVVVLCTATGPRGGERTVLLGLRDDGTPLWRRDFGADAGAARALAELPGGGLVLAGEIETAPLRFASRALRAGADGELLDARPVGDGASLTCVTVLAAGRVLAGGVRDGAGWVHLGQSERVVADVAEVVAVAPLPAGGFAIAAIEERSTTALGRTRVAAYGDACDERWSCGLPARGRAEPAAALADRLGAVTIAGHAQHDEPAAIWVARVSARGAPLWERTLRPAHGAWRGRAVALLPGGDVAVAGDAALGARRVAAVARLRPDGTLVWQRTFDAVDETARGLAATADGGVLLAGSAASPSAGTSRALVRRLDGAGRELWTRTFL